MNSREKNSKRKVMLKNWFLLSMMLLRTLEFLLIILRENSNKLPILYMNLQKTTFSNFFCKKLPYVMFLFAKDYLLTDRLVLTVKTNFDYHV